MKITRFCFTTYSRFFLKPNIIFITNQNKDLALDYYNKAINGSELLNDKSFRERVIEEKK